MDVHPLPNVPFSKVLIRKTYEYQVEARFARTAERRCVTASETSLSRVLARLCRIAVIAWSRLPHINGLPTAADHRVSRSYCGSAGVQSEQAPGLRSFRARAGCRKCRPVGQVCVGVQSHHV